MEHETEIIKGRCKLINDHFQNFKTYGIPHAQLIIADPPYNLGKNAYASNPAWYKDGDNANGESELAGKEFFDTDKDFRHAGKVTNHSHQERQRKFYRASQPRNRVSVRRNVL